MSQEKKVVVAGATGAVGRTMVRVLEERDFPISHLKLCSSSRSAGKILTFRGEEIVVEELNEQSFDGLDIALFSMPKGISRKFAPVAAKAGCVVVDNSNAWRMDPEVPLVVPEVNPQDIAKHKGIIANPNCSTIQMVVALKPLHDAAKLKRVVVSTYQAVSGVSLDAIAELKRETMESLDGKTPRVDLFPKQIAFNCLPQIPQSDAFTDDGYTTEELKMLNETRKIMGDDSILVSATTVRVPVVIGHSEVVNAEFHKPLSPEEARKLLSAFPGVIVMDDPSKEIYPTAIDCADRDEVFVGRIRRDISCDNALNLWIVSDNLRKGAATNAVQIAQALL